MPGKLSAIDRRKREKKNRRVVRSNLYQWMMNLKTLPYWFTSEKCVPSDYQKVGRISHDQIGGKKKAKLVGVIF